MDQITSKTFFHIWYSTVLNRRTEFTEIWRNNKQVTNYVKGSENSIVNEVAKQLNLMCYEQDYYAIDAVFYKEEDRVPRIPDNSTWFRRIRIAFEHENNYKAGLYQEVSHLLITNCDLRVLVTYPTDEDLSIELNYLHMIISGSESAKTISEKENFLIIFGYENNFEWDGYVFKTDGWMKIDKTQ